VARAPGGLEGDTAIERVALALAVWVVATIAIAAPVSLYLRRQDELTEPVDEAEVAASRRRHPSRSGKAA
jgi:hypothetical protein